MTTSCDFSLGSRGPSFLGAIKATFTNVIYHLKPFLPLGMCLWTCSHSALPSIRISLFTCVIFSLGDVMPWEGCRLQASATFREKPSLNPPALRTSSGSLLSTAPIWCCLTLSLRFKPKAMWATRVGSRLSRPSRVTDNSSPGQYLNRKLTRDPKPEPPNHTTPNFPTHSNYVG